MGEKDFDLRQYLAEGWMNKPAKSVLKEGQEDWPYEENPQDYAAGMLTDMIWNCNAPIKRDRFKYPSKKEYPYGRIAIKFPDGKRIFVGCEDEGSSESPAQVFDNGTWRPITDEEVKHYIASDLFWECVVTLLDTGSQDDEDSSDIDLSFGVTPEEYEESAKLREKALKSLTNLTHDQFEKIAQEVAKSGKDPYFCTPDRVKSSINYCLEYWDNYDKPFDGMEFIDAAVSLGYLDPNRINYKRIKEIENKWYDGRDRYNHIGAYAK